jgi:hypothetical protein
MKPATVFHIILWTDSQTGIEFTVAGMSTFASRTDADRVADVYREALFTGYTNNGTLEEAYHSRVGVLEMPEADSRLKHPAPASPEDVEKIIAELRERVPNICRPKNKS